MKIKLENRLKDSFKLEVRSLVTTSYIGKKIPLTELAKKINCVYEPDQFPGLVYYTKIPKITFQIFSTGKINSFGGRNLEEVNGVFSAILEKIGISDNELSKVDFPKICTMTVVFDFGKKLDLQKIRKLYFYETYTDQNKFRNVRFLFKNNRLATVFSSGKIVLMGGRSMEENMLISQILYKKLMVL